MKAMPSLAIEGIMPFTSIAIGLIIANILLAQFLAPQSYDWTSNTVSELASQGYSGKWIMQLGFIGFGIFLSAGIGTKLRATPGLWYREVPLLVYAVSILLSGIFCEKPFLEGLPYSETEAQLHSFFAMAAGFSLSIAILVTGILEPGLSRKIAHYGVLVFVIAMSLLFGASRSGTGIIQRIMYLGSFAWIAFLYNSA
jgi:hypothetical protein